MPNFYIIAGCNGAGKTTLLQLCATLIHPTKGSVKILGSELGKFDVFELRTRIGITSSAFVKDFPDDESGPHCGRIGRFVPSNFSN